MKEYIKLLWIIMFIDGTEKKILCEYDGEQTYEFEEFTITANNSFEALKEFKAEEPNIKSINIYQYYDGMVWFNAEEK